MNKKKEKAIKFLSVLVCCILLFSITLHSNLSYIRIDTNKNSLRSSAEYDPAGLIALWSGPLNTIPAGWKLLDGTGGTINTTNRFIYSTDSLESPGATGGSSSHNHSYNTVPLHDHGGVTSTTTTPHSHIYRRGAGITVISTGPQAALSPVEGNTDADSALHSHGVEYTGETDCYTSEEENFIPPYYKLAYIEKETSDTIIPTGLIVMWTGSIENIPTSWELCNGSNGTPDLRENFIQGVTSGEDPGFSGA